MFRTVVGPSSELLLDGLGQEVAVDDGIGRDFIGEFGVKVLDIGSVGLEKEIVSYLF